MAESKEYRLTHPKQETNSAAAYEFDQEIALSSVSKPKKRLWCIGELAALPNPEWLLEPFIMRNSVAALIGEPGIGKTFIALDYSLKLCARGEVVIYIAGEGLSGYKKRIEAWRTFHKLEAEGFYLWSEPVDLLDISSVKAFLTEVASRKPVSYTHLTLPTT